MGNQKPKYVRCPEPFAPLFVQAEAEMEKFFREFKQSPENGTITISNERYILVRTESLVIEFREILEKEYGKLAVDKILYNFSRACGIRDAEFFIQKMGLEKGPSALSAGPVHFAFVGWALVDIFPESRPTTDENYYLIYEHPASFEADAYIKAGIKTDRPVCHMNCGYSSGWCQVSFGVELVAKEISCRAAGDPKCIMVMGHPSKINQYVIEAKEKYGIKK